MRVKRSIKKIFRGLGYEIIASKVFRELSERTAHVGMKIMDKIIACRPDVIFDVGANAGQYAIQLRKRGYSGKIVSFEPLLGHFEKLKKLSEVDSQWLVYNLALGGVPWELTINVSKNLVCEQFVS